MTRVKTQSLSDRVREAIYEYIKSMDVKNNTKLPREEILAKNLGVSRVTIRKVLNDLAQEGMIFRIHGKGTFVNSEALQSLHDKATIDPAQDFDKIILNSGYEVNVDVIGFREELAKDIQCSKLKVGAGEKVATVEKVLYADGKFAIFSIYSFPRAIMCEDLSTNDLKISPFKLLKKRSEKKVTWYKTELSTIISTENSKISSCANYDKPKSLLVSESIYFDQYNVPIVWDTVYIDTDIVKFNVIRQKL
jgi:GntR family transcriptional regulator